MADIGYVVGELAGIQDEATRRILERIFRHVVREMRFGEPENQTKALNFTAIYQGSTTGTSTGEFSMAHGMSVTPRLAVPIINLNQVGAQTVPLEVTRVADGKRVYLKTSAGSTNVPFWLLIE